MNAKETQEFLAQFDGELISANLFYGTDKYHDYEHHSISVFTPKMDGAGNVVKDKDGNILYDNHAFNVKLSEVVENENGDNASESWTKAVHEKKVREVRNVHDVTKPKLMLGIMFLASDIQVKTNNITGNQRMVLTRFALREKD